MMAACSFPECGRRCHAKGLCPGHYRQRILGTELRPLHRQIAGDVCSFDGCGRPYCGLGLCHSHLAQMKKGRALTPIRVPFSCYVQEAVSTREHGEECWLDWPGHRNHEDRPVVNPPGSKKVFAYRYAFFLVHGEWPVMACHRCPTHPFGEDPRCWNPAHIYNGNYASNGADRARFMHVRKAARQAAK